MALNVSNIVSPFTSTNSGQKPVSPLTSTYNQNIGASLLPTPKLPLSNLVASQAPSTPVKSISVDADGSHSVTYHAPKSPAPSTAGNAVIPTTPTGPQYSSSGGAVIPQAPAGTPAPTVQQPTPQPTASTAGLLSTTPVSFGGLVGGLAGYNPFNNPQVSNAYNQAISTQQQLAALQQQEAEALKENANAPIPIGDITGRQANLSNFYAQKEAALGSELQGLGSIYQGGFTGTGQQQQALSTAAGLAQPQLTAPGQAVFNPLTQSYTSATSSGSNPSVAPAGIDQTSWNNYVQMAANGQISSIPSSITGNANLSGQLNAAAKQLNPNYSPITSAAQGVSAADLTGQASSIQAQANGAEANFKLMQNIAQQGGVNNNNVPILNTLQQNVQRGLTSSVAVTNFQSLLQSVRSQYATILGGGTTTVESLQEAQSLIPDDISLSALDSLGTNLQSDAQNRVAGINQQIQSLTSSGSTPNRSAPTQSSSTIQTPYGTIDPSL